MSSRLPITVFLYIMRDITLRLDVMALRIELHVMSWHRDHIFMTSPLRYLFNSSTQLTSGMLI